MVRVKVVAPSWVELFLESFDDCAVMFRNGTEILRVHYLEGDIAAFGLSCSQNTDIEFEPYYPTSRSATSQGTDGRSDSWSTQRVGDSTVPVHAVARLQAATSPSRMRSHRGRLWALSNAPSASPQQTTAVPLADRRLIPQTADGHAEVAAKPEWEKLAEW